MPYIVPVATNDFFEVRLVGRLDGQICINTFRYNIIRASGSGALDMEPMIDDFETGVWTELRKIMSAEYQLATLFLQKIHPARYVSFEKIPTSRIGGVASGNAPSTVTYVFRRKLLLAGRRYQGRIFLPAVPNENIEGSLVKDTVVSGEDVANIATGMLDTLEPGAGVEAVPSLIVPNGASWDNRGALNAVTLDNVLHVQRRREVGSGI